MDEYVLVKIVEMNVITHENYVVKYNFLFVFYLAQQPVSVSLKAWSIDSM